MPRKKIRLSASRYIGKQIYFLTLCTDERHAAFANQSVGHWVLTRLLGACTKHDFAVHAYCAMPDHLHILAGALAANGELVRFVSAFKQETGFAYQKRFHRRLWQPRYYDHILRKAEESERVAWYIWLNPVRKGLCRAPQEYALSGSFTFADWRERCAAVESWVPPWKGGKMPG
ncbi:MAG: REP-associated tyrosine transposase [Candidatus Acidiferrales bacterium]